MNWSEIQGYTVAQGIRFQILKYGWKRIYEGLFFNELVRNTGIHCSSRYQVSFKSENLRCSAV